MSGKLDKNFWVGICTDGAAATNRMTGSLCSFTNRIKEVASDCEATHCVIYRKMLASRKLSLDSVLNVVITVIKTIKPHALNSCILNKESHCKDSSQKIIHQLQLILITQNETYKWHTCVIFSINLLSSISPFREKCFQVGG
jgi:hypothetical protein